MQTVCNNLFRIKLIMIEANRKQLRHSIVSHAVVNNCHKLSVPWDAKKRNSLEYQMQHMVSPQISLWPYLRYDVGLKAGVE